MSRRAGRLLIGGLLAVGGVGALIGAIAGSHSHQHSPSAFSTISKPATSATATSRPAAANLSIARHPPSAARVAATPAPVAIPQPFQADRLEIDALRVDAPVGEIFSVQRELLPPDDPHQVGWWAGSSLPGSSKGATVLVGHVDTADQGLGALYSLDKVHPGMLVRLSGDAGAASYRINTMTYYPKISGLPQTLFTTTGTGRLVLISCGGSFDTQARSYRDNVVVTASLVH